MGEGGSFSRSGKWLKFMKIIHNFNHLGIGLVLKMVIEICLVATKFNCVNGW